MDSFVTVLVICLISGLAFLLGSLIVVSKLPRIDPGAGNTVIEWNGIKVTTSNVFVALSIVSAALALAIPMSALWLDSHMDDTLVVLRAPLPPPQHGTSYSVVHSDDISEMKASAVTLSLYRSRIPQIFEVSTAVVHPVTIEAYYDWMTKSVIVTLNNDQRTKHSIALQGNGFADIGQLPFTAAPEPGRQTIAQTQQPRPPVASEFRALPDPVLPVQK